MKSPFTPPLVPITLLLAAPLALGDPVFTNFIRQIQVNSGTERDLDVGPNGVDVSSPLEINPGGARFELWTVKQSPLVAYHLAQQYVSASVPRATLQIVTEDNYAAIKRTRADRPFLLQFDVTGFSTDPSTPDGQRMVQFQHHLQSYGPGGTGENIDPSQATEHQTILVDQSPGSLQYALSALPGADLAKRRGEERFTVRSLPDYQVPNYLTIAEARVQIWPVADGEITGVEENQQLRFDTPPITLTLNDLYPDSRTYAQLYPGPRRDNAEGTVIAGSGYVVQDVAPKNSVLVLEEWDTTIYQSGTWTMEILTVTPFGVDRLDHVTFEINRDIQINGTVTTIE